MDIYELWWAEGNMDDTMIYTHAGVDYYANWYNGYPKMSGLFDPWNSPDGIVGSRAFQKRGTETSQYYVFNGGTLQISVPCGDPPPERITPLTIQNFQGPIGGDTDNHYWKLISGGGSTCPPTSSSSTPYPSSSSSSSSSSSTTFTTGTTGTTGTTPIPDTTTTVEPCCGGWPVRSTPAEPPTINPPTTKLNPSIPINTERPDPISPLSTGITTSTSTSTTTTTTTTTTLTPEDKVFPICDDKDSCKKLNF